MGQEKEEDIITQIYVRKLLRYTCEQTVGSLTVYT